MIIEAIILLAIFFATIFVAINDSDAPIITNILCTVSIMMPFLSVGLTAAFLLALKNGAQRMANKAEKEGQFNEPVDYEITAEQIYFKARFLESRLNWETCKRIVETEDLFLLIYFHNTAQFFSKNAFKSIEDQNFFKEIVQSKYSSKK